MPHEDRLTSGTAGSPAPVAMLDHVAVAVEQWADAWPRYAVELGGQWASGGLNVGFGPAQLRYANGARLEILQPWAWEENPFLRRFLDHGGPGPHHLTFKVPDIRHALERARKAGFEPVGVELGDPMWKEAFLHPRQAVGIVVQLAEATGEWSGPAPDDFPALRHQPPAELEHVVHAVADLRPALALFGDLLGGTVRGEGGDGGWEYVELAWAGPLSVRLVASTGGRPDDTVGRFLGGRPGRLHHLAWRVDDPGRIRGAAISAGVMGADPGPTWVVEPEANLGVRLVLHAPEGSGGSGG